MRWTLDCTTAQDELEQLHLSLNRDPERPVDLLVSQLLLNRGIKSWEEAKTFFRPELEHLHDPFLMKGMHIAVERIIRAIEKEERILIYGDYDVDGTTAVSLVYEFLSQYSSQLMYYIPDRYKEGYGISLQGIEFAKDHEISLIIALDCGIKDYQAIALANSYSIDTVVCDHHQPSKQLPEAFAILNPKQEDCNYPYKELCGCGVGFKLIQALSLKWGLSIEELCPYLDFVALAIGADMVPLDGENRILAYWGMLQIQKGERIAFRTLLGGQKELDELSLTDLNFSLAPKINAAGRMKHAEQAVSLMLVNNEEQAVDLADQIKKYNLERRALDQSITQQALKQISESAAEKSATTVVYNPNWHKGVVGIVASKLIAEFYRPTIVLTKASEGEIAGSARSVKGYDLYAAIDACSSTLIQFGGHQYAAGLRLKEENLTKFKDAFEAHVAHTIATEQQEAELIYEAELDISEIAPKLLRILNRYRPYGPKNPQPLFISTGIKVQGPIRCIGKDQTHLKFNVAHCEAIGFSMADKKELLNGAVDLAYHIEENNFRNQRKLQLRLVDIKPSIR
ncbi:MAG: single-stranded-DNA-specific exonuclease RecJ [Flavobacteriaceae bacterium]|nr:single-stranded-DNA-specific exonuclease RecJ [Flavobacteriaceae bacterium]